MKSIIKISLLAIVYGSNPLYAADSLTVKTIGLDLARDIANESVLACRKKGYQVIRLAW